MKLCETCNKPADRPWRRVDDHGRIVEGCVSYFHGKAVTGADKAWHDRPVAAEIRLAVLRADRAILIGEPEQ